ncbi:OLC1v1019411C2 [Oldenlandia corymbosa var. corymbosa]|uniref:OLC1v1019411C2 n=1 Tax=Oldenlandia corymbosa var. corymbosa TaxID=529605 RepID=A0AAV1EE09_OLDCO|nr:OLC1v1019411C2 [Oldenlandia corymbosa var. corymbosa]
MESAMQPAGEWAVEEEVAVVQRNGGGGETKKEEMLLHYDGDVFKVEVEDGYSEKVVEAEEAEEDEEDSLKRKPPSTAVNRTTVSDKEEMLDRHHDVTSRTTSDDNETNDTITNGSTSSVSSGTSDAGDDQVEVEAATGEGDIIKPEENRVYFQTHAGTVVEQSQINVKGNTEDWAARLREMDIEVLMNAALRGTPIENKKIEYYEGKTSEEIKRKKRDATVIYEMDESDEEVVELEFETAVKKMHSHDGYGMYCPNCSSQITKVVLRRKIKQRKVLVASDNNERKELLGCLSCFRVFIPSGNRLNPFRIFGAGRDHGESSNIRIEEQLPVSDVVIPAATPEVPVPTLDSAQITERGFDLFWFLKNRRTNEQHALTSPLLSTNSLDTAVTSKPTSDEGFDQKAQSTRDESNDQLCREQPTTDVTVLALDNVPQKQGKGFDLFWFSRKRSEDEHDLTSPLLQTASQPGNEATEKGTTHEENVDQPRQEQPISDVTIPTNDSSQVAEKGFDLFWFLRKRREDENSTTSPLLVPAQIQSSPTAFIRTDVIQPSTTVTTPKQRDEIIEQGKVPQTSTPQGSPLDGNVIIDIHRKQEVLISGTKPVPQPKLQTDGGYHSDGADVRISVVESTIETGIQESTFVSIGDTISEIVVTEPRTPSGSFDVLKSIVYGGLMESITSLLVISLAAALNATTKNVMAMGFAYLVGGFILLIHNVSVVNL